MSDGGRVLGRLDHLTAVQAGGLGLAAGLSGMGLLAAPGWARLAVGAGALGGAALLARSAGWVERRRVPVPNAPQYVLDMVEIPAGRFIMGASNEASLNLGAHFGVEAPAFPITFRAPRWMQRCPVTNEEFRKIRPKHAQNEGAHLPATDVSWFDAIAFCNAMSAVAGLLPVYKINDRAVSWSDSDGYRLPTESEWEYCCRGGQQTPYSFGDDPFALRDHAWFLANSQLRKRVVRQKLPNRFGLHDMHGNVKEWCWSEIAKYPLPSVKKHHTKNGNVRVVRGGAFDEGIDSLRCSARAGEWPENRSNLVGFRCVRGSRPKR